jgi:amino acid adenylation domain-containing protein
VLGPGGVEEIALEGIELEEGPLAVRDRNELLRLAKETLGFEPDNIESDLVAAGAQSLDLIRLLNAAERELGFVPNRETFFARPTLATLASTRSTTALVEPLESGSLTTAEMQLWILEKEEDVDGAYNQQFAVQILGNVSAVALRQALEQTVRGHAALRTTFPTVGGGAGREIHGELAPEFRVIDCTRGSILESEQDAFDVLAREATRAFDLARGPLVRGVLVRQWIGKHVFMLVAHHIVVDEWSLGRIFLPEFAARYAALTDAAIAEPARDRGADGHRPSSEIVREEDVEWWRRELRGVPDVLPWPSSRERPERLTFRGRTHVAELSASSCARLTEVARRAGVTPASAFLAVTQLLIARLCNQTRFCVGIYATNRASAAREREIGYSVNLVPVLADIEGDPSVADLLRAAHGHAMSALAHSAVPFARIVQAIKPSRVAAVQPLVQAVFAVDDLPSGLALGNEEARRVVIDARRAKFDLTITISLRAPSGRPCVRWEYRSDLFDAATIARWAALFARIVDEMAFDRTTSVRALALLRPDDVEELICNLNPQPTPLHESSTMEMIERAAERVPGATALAALGERISYAQLWSQSAAVASHLRGQGVEPGEIIGIMLQRRIALPLAIVGAMRARATFLPLDPQLPSEHLAWIVRHAGVRIVLCDAESSERISGCTRISIDDARQTAPVELVAPRGQDIAYVQFTSGSTGRPKGVRVPHKSLLNVLGSVADRVAKAQPPIWLAITSAAFDISILELLLPLTVGGTVVVHPGLTSNCGFEPWIAGPAGARSSVLAHVTHLQCTPSGLEAILGSRDGRRLLAQLKCLVVGGEAFPVGLAARARAATDARIWNAYGPTETTIWSSMHEVRADETRIPIGRPLANTRFYVMDSSRCLAPRGCRGELYIAGDGVAAGYLNRPDETDARFLPDPFSSDPDARMYRTGDVVRWNAHDELEFLGRNDDQIKVRGFRVEPAEIERAILEIPTVARCAVIPKVLNGRTLAVAFVVPEDSDTERLRAELAAKLPHYMVPSAFVAMNELPRTVNGKIDRKELAARADSMRGDDERVEPRSELERIVLEVWREELRNPAIGVRDDFFQIGGDSLVALSVVSRLQRETGRALRLSMFTSLRTVENFANALGDGDATSRTFVLSGPRRPLRSLRGRLDPERDGPVDAAAIATLPDDSMLKAIGDGAAILDDALWGATLTVERGRIAMLFVPILDRDVYRPESRLLERCTHALDYARTLGARAVSLTGLIPSATDYGAAFRGRDYGLHVTNGHATTCAAICLNIEHVLARARRPMPKERLAFLGLGSIGLGTLKTLMRLGAAPRSILLCEVSGNRARAESARKELAEVWRYPGEVAVSLVDTNAGADLRHATLIVGATNLPGVLPVHLLDEGCIVVDDSAPHCFVSADALTRMEERGDVLFTQAGAVRSPSAVDVIVGSAAADPGELASWIAEAFGPDEREIMACTLSALITATARDVVATTGMPDVDTCIANRSWLASAGYKPAPMRIGANLLSATFIERFAARFGRTR